MDIFQSCKEVVLFADDSKTVRLAARKALQEKYTVVEASSGDEAWKEIKNNPVIELVFADINMPESNGFELLQKIRTSDTPHIANLPVVIITGAENSEAAMHAALNLGATDFISKPFRQIDLLSRTYSYITLNKKIRSLESDAIEDKVNGFYITKQYEIYATKCLSFANRYKNACSFSYIEIDVLSDIYRQKGKDILNQMLEQISQRLSGVFREEDLIAQLSINRFGLVMPATSQVKCGVVVQRLIEVINAMAFDIDNVNYRLSAKAAIYTSCDFENTYADIACILDAAITHGRDGSNGIVTCDDKHTDDIDSAEVKESAFMAALIHVLNGDYHKIAEGDIAELSDMLSPFINYASSRNNCMVSVAKED